MKWVWRECVFPARNESERLDSELVIMRGMVIDMDEAKLQTVAQVKAFLEGTHDIALKIPKVEQYREGIEAIWLYPTVSAR